MSGCGRNLARFGIILTFVSLCNCQDSNATTIAAETTEHPKIQLLNKWRENNTANGKKERPALTGIPQIDYAFDPNLPHELHGYNLSDYPFYNRVPNVKFNFSCDDRHDGFYASIPHKCQVYHNCLFGVRYDFLCANYTAFDQSNFICHWANSVDCDNSELYYDRNNELYVEATTTTTTTAAPVIKIVYVDRQTGNVRKGPGGNRGGPMKKKPTPKPQQEAVYEDAVYDYEYEVKPQQSGKNTKKQNINDYYYDDATYYDDVTEAPTTTTTTQKPQAKRRPNRPLKTRIGDLQSTNSRQDQRTKLRVHPNQQLPDFDFEGATTGARQPQRPQQEGQRDKPQLRRRKKTTTTTSTTPAPEYYDDYYYDDEAESSPVTEATKRRPLPGSRPTAADRRKALLTSRVSHLVPKSIPPTNSDPVEPVAEEPAAEEPAAEELPRNRRPSPAERINDEPQRNVRPSPADRVVEEPPRNSRPLPAEPVVEETPRVTRPSTRVRTQNPVTPQPETDSFRSASYDEYDYEVLPPAEAVKEPELEPVPVNSRRRGATQIRRTPSQIDRARTRREVIHK